MQHKIEQKIARITYYIELLEEYKPNCKERFIQDSMYEGALLHYLYLVSDGSIALAEMVIKYKNFAPSQSYYDAIDRLGENKVLPREFAYSFSKIASFRNFLAHDYEKIDYLVICEEALEKLDEIKKYLDYISKVI